MPLSFRAIIIIKQFILFTHNACKVEQQQSNRLFLENTLNMSSPYNISMLVAQIVKNLPAMQEIWVRSLGQEDPMEKEMATPPVSLPEKFHGQRSLVGYSPWGRKRARHDRATHTHTHIICIIYYIFIICKL